MKDRREAEDNFLHSVRSVPLGRIAITASVIGIMIAGYLFFSSRPGDWQGTAVPIVETRNGAPPAARFWTNTSGKDSLCQLPDGSMATLAPNSRLSFQQDPIRDIRRILLTGQALFDVAPDRSKPFTVYSGEIVITALGTQFLVSDKDMGALSVWAYEGKVKVNTHPDEPELLKTYYLVAGNELVYDRQKDFSRMLLFGPSKPGSWFTFNNASLAETLDQLAAVYGKPILYSREQLQGLSLVGKIERRHPLAGILKEIASMNSLSVIEEKDGYRVEKK